MKRTPPRRTARAPAATRSRVDEPLPASYAASCPAPGSSELTAARERKRRQVSRLVQAAGLPPAFGIEALAARAESGVPVDVIAELKEWMPASIVTRSIASPSTLSRRVRSGERLTGAEADRALRVVAIVRQAVRVFGDADKAQRWLSKPKQFLDPNGPGRTPYEMLDSEHGARLVEQRLTQIDHGLFA
jgi:putative toxin-antitoxin system antitoxin component (TIGR02293 family)